MEQPLNKTKMNSQIQSQIFRKLKLQIVLSLMLLLQG